MREEEREMDRKIVRDGGRHKVKEKERLGEEERERGKERVDEIYGQVLSSPKTQTAFWQPQQLWWLHKKDRIDYFKTDQNCQY